MRIFRHRSPINPLSLPSRPRPLPAAWTPGTTPAGTSTQPLPAVRHIPPESFPVNLAPFGRTLLISDVLDTFPTASSYPQVCQHELCHGLCPIPVRSSSWGTPSAWTIPPPLDRLHLVIDDAGTRMPHLPQPHLPATPRTTERITTRTGQHASAVGLLHHNTIRPFDQPTQRHHQCGEHPLHFLDLARGMQPIIADAMEPFRQNMLHHPTDERQRRYLFLLPLFSLVIVVPIPPPLPIVAQDASEGDRGADDVFRQVVRQPLTPSRDFPLFQVGDQAAGIRAPQSVDLGFHRARAHPLLQHREEMILPLFVQHREGEIIHLPPLLLWDHPARGHQDMQMRIPMPRAPRGLQHHHVA